MTPDMPDEQKTKLRLEIAHVLFIDIVGYSKLRTTEQSAHIEKLRKIVRGPTNFALPKPKENSSVCRPVTAARSSFATWKRQFFARLILPTRCGIIRNFASAWEFTAVRSRGDRSQRAGEHCRSRNQHCSTRDGLRRCRPHPGFKARRRRSRTIRSMAAVSPRSRGVRNQTRRATESGQFLQPQKSAIPRCRTNSRRRIKPQLRLHPTWRSRYSTIALGIGALIVVGAAALFFASRTAFRTASGALSPRWRWLRGFRQKYRCSAV